MRLLRWLLGVIVVIGIAIGIYMLTPVRGPARDTTLVGDVERGNYLIRLGGCVTCHTDPKNKDVVLAGSQSAGLKTMARPILRPMPFFLASCRMMVSDTGNTVPARSRAIL